MKEFVLPFFGLKLGFHTFNFNIDREFFAAFESTLVEDAQFKVTLGLEKLTNMLVLHFSAEGTMNDFCDRCGDPIALDISATDQVFVKFGDEDYGQTDEILVVSHETHEIDVSQLIYEMIVLNIPGKKTHATIEECNKEVIKRLEGEKNAGDDNQSQENIDPRWDALKKLK